jgi:arylsulfatase A-like enzyme
MRFTQGYSNSANCSPTRTGLATGRYQMRLPVGLEEPINASTPKAVGLPPSHPTLPSLLKKAGYGTSLVGKWHLGYLPDYSPLKSGYDAFFGIFGGAADYFNHGPDASRNGPEAHQLHEQEVPVERHGYMTNLLGDRAVETIDGFAKSKEPFLLSLHFTAPHWPSEGPDDEAESKRIRNIFHRDGGTQKTYMAMMQSLDSNIGRVLQALDVHGLAANTIVVFTSDNGGERFSDNWPFSGMKGVAGRRAAHSGDRAGPSAFRRESVRAGRDLDGLDAHAAGGPGADGPGHPPDGDNLLPVLSGRASPHPRKLFWRFKSGGQRAVRDGDWKYLRSPATNSCSRGQDPRSGPVSGSPQGRFRSPQGDWAAWVMLPERARPAP